jgi:hypothetical protein
MKRFIVNILVFFAIVAAMDFGIGLVGDYMQSHSKGGPSKRINDLLINDEHNVLILGSSRAFHHYDTPFLSDTLGIDVYNAGYDGNGIILADGILQMVLERYKPSLIVYDVEPAFDIEEYINDKGNVRYISHLKPYYKHTCISSIIRDISYEEWCKVHSGMLRYNTNIVPLTIDIFEDRGVENKGFSPIDGEMKADPVYTLDEDNPISVNSVKIRYFNDLIDICKDKKIKLIMIASPRYGSKSMESIEIAKGICEEKGIQFIDYYNDDSFMHHKEWFKEPMHLNRIGARQFSRQLVEIFQKIKSE